MVGSATYFLFSLGLVGHNLEFLIIIIIIIMIMIMIIIIMIINNNNAYISILPIFPRGSRRARLSPDEDWNFLVKNC